MIKKADVILLFAVVAAFGIVIGAFFLFGSGGGCAVIRQDGEEIMRLPLNENTEVSVCHDAYGENIVVVEGGRVYVSFADCPDQICVKHRAVSQEGEIITCLPHRLTVEVEK